MCTIINRSLTNCTSHVLVVIIFSTCTYFVHFRHLCLICSYQALFRPPLARHQSHHWQRIPWLHCPPQPLGPSLPLPHRRRPLSRKWLSRASSQRSPLSSRR